MKQRTEESGVPQPTQQLWPRGNPNTLPKDIYGEHGQHRPVVYVASESPQDDAEKLLREFLPRAIRRPVTESEIAEYVTLVTAKLEEGTAFQDSMLSAYRMILTSTDVLLLEERGIGFRTLNSGNLLMLESCMNRTYYSLKQNDS